METFKSEQHFPYQHSGVVILKICEEQSEARVGSYGSQAKTGADPNECRHNGEVVNKVTDPPNGAVANERLKA